MTRIHLGVYRGHLVYFLCSLVTPSQNAHIFTLNIRVEWLWYMHHKLSLENNIMRTAHEVFQSSSPPFARSMYAGPVRRDLCDPEDSNGNGRSTSLNALAGVLSADLGASPKFAFARWKLALAGGNFPSGTAALCTRELNLK